MVELVRSPKNLLSPGGLVKHWEHLAVVGLVGVCVLGVLLIVGFSLAHRKQTHAELSLYGPFGITGRLGGGKSYLMAHLAARAMKSGRAVFANFELEGATLYDSWEQVVRVPDGSMVLMDEAHLWWPSEAWKAPPEVRVWVTDLRKHDQTLLFATQVWGFVGKRLRQLSFGVWEGVHYRRGHQYSLYEGRTFERAKRDRISRMYVVRQPEVMAMYNTKGVVQAPRDDWANPMALGASTTRQGAAANGSRRRMA